MTWSYNVGQLATSTLMQVRRIIGDTLPGDQQLQDEEITWIAGRFTTIYGAAAECCRSIASQFARKVDTVTGEMRTMYSAQTKRYMSMAAQFEMYGLRGATPYAGAMSNTDKNNVAQDTDRVPPDFPRHQWDDLLPVGQTGEQTNTSSQPDTGLPDTDSGFL